MHLLQEHTSRHGKIIQHDRSDSIRESLFYGLPIMTIRIWKYNRHYG